MKEFFNKTDDIYVEISNKLVQTKDTCSEQMKNVSNLLTDYKSTCKKEKHLKVLKDVIYLFIY